MDETIYVIFKVQFDFALEVWFSVNTSQITNDKGTEQTGHMSRLVCYFDVRVHSSQVFSRRTHVLL